MAKFGVILSGCGVFDGAEIQEAVACLHAIDKRGDTYACLAPDREFDTVDHLTQKPTGERRSVLREAARIARGEITSLKDVKGSDYDAIVLPGGFGAAKNLCTFAVDGPSCSVDPDVARVLKEAHGAGRPIGFACIAPAVGAAVFGKELHPHLTIGTDEGTAGGLEQLGAVHEPREPTGVVIDEANRIVSTPCYMSASRVSEVFEGCDKMVGAIKDMLG
ncbi:MAG: isoprenoid biosynthesis glyoxalase ElbB [Phycisphaerales bacterium JB059]